MGLGTGRHIRLPVDDTDFPVDDKQLALGAQSYRGSPSKTPMEKFNGDPRALELFGRLFANEEKLCGGFAAFYHSYSHAALLYEVRAAVASVLHGFCSLRSPLPRLLAKDFQNISGAAELMKKVKEEWGPTHSDHNAEFRRVGISTMCSLLATGPECCVLSSFYDGYSCKGIAFRQVLEHELCQSFGAMSEDVAALLGDILALSENHGLDTCMFGGGPSSSGHAGHLLQVFVRRDLVDHLCYPAKPYGEVEEDKLPFSSWMNGDHSFAWGQARIFANPEFLLQWSAVRMFSISADPLFQDTRERFQARLIGLLRRFIKQQQRRHRRRVPFCCLSSKVRPSSPKPPAAATLNVTVPANWEKGLPLKVTAPNGQTVLIASFPEGLEPGATFQTSYVPKPEGASSTPAHATLTVKVPQGLTAGSEFMAKFPDGQLVLLNVPEGLTAGSSFEVPYAPQLQI